MLRTLPNEQHKRLHDATVIAEMLSEADIVPLLMSLVQLTCDRELLEEAAPYIHGAWNFQEAIPAPLRRTIIDRLAAILARGEDLQAAPLSRELLRRMIDVAAGEKVAEEFVPLLLEESGLEPAEDRGLVWRKQPDKETLAAFHVIIVGAGLSGICMGIRLKQAGVPFTIIEKNRHLGGTWYENTYPDCRVDTPSHFYCFSFAPNDWSRHFSDQREVLAYLERCARDFRILEHIRFQTEATEAVYEAGEARWRVTLRDAQGQTEEVRCNILVPAVGQLTHAAFPDVPGLQTFAGALMHSSRWNADVQLEGKRVVMVGTGASGIQIGPAVAEKAAHFTVIQRTPHWVMHNPNYHLPITSGSRWAYHNVPYYRQWIRFQLFWATGDRIHDTLRKDPNWPHADVSLNARNHEMREALIAYARSKVGHRPDLLEKVIPSYPPYGKRMLRDNHWFDMLLKPHVSLYNDEIAEVLPDRVRLNGGEEIEADVLIFATGFQAARMIVSPAIINASGTSLRYIWGDEEPRAFLGVAVPEFPNMFILYGPNTNVGHGGSVIYQVECQVRYILRCIREMIEGGYSSIECTREAFEDYNRRVDEEHAQLVWTHPGKKNWYQNSKGRVVTNTPWRLVDYWQFTRELKTSDFTFGPGRAEH